jgi:hypothetical protein
LNILTRVAECLGFFRPCPGEFASDNGEEVWRLNLIDPERIEERIRLLSQRMW